LQLEDLGWDAFFADAFQPYEQQGLTPARVAARHHGPCELLTEHGRIGGLPAGKLEGLDLPVAGDWVAVRELEGERKGIVEAILPRRTTFTRKEAWRRTVAQVVAANVDTIFLVTAFGQDLNPRRLERYLTAAWDSGATPVIVVNKSDTATDPEDDLEALPCTRSARRPAPGSTSSSPISGVAGPWRSWARPESANRR
jgi:ribosome biogenesis GTPase